MWLRYCLWFGILFCKLAIQHMTFVKQIHLTCNQIMNETSQCIWDKCFSQMFLTNISHKCFLQIFLTNVSWKMFLNKCVWTIFLNKRFLTNVFDKCFWLIFLWMKVQHGNTLRRSIHFWCFAIHSFLFIITEECHIHQV